MSTVNNATLEVISSFMEKTIFHFHWLSYNKFSLLPHRNNNNRPCCNFFQPTSLSCCCVCKKSVFLPSLLLFSAFTDKNQQHKSSMVSKKFANLRKKNKFLSLDTLSFFALIFVYNNKNFPRAICVLCLLLLLLHVSSCSDKPKFYHRLLPPSIFFLAWLPGCFIILMSCQEW